jgi:hypothetical protein
VLQCHRPFFAKTPLKLDRKDLIVFAHPGGPLEVKFLAHGRNRTIDTEMEVFGRQKYPGLHCKLVGKERMNARFLLGNCARAKRAKDGDRSCLCCNFFNGPLPNILKCFSDDLDIMARVQVEQTGPDGDNSEMHSLRRIPARVSCGMRVRRRGCRRKS